MSDEKSSYELLIMNDEFSDKSQVKRKKLKVKRISMKSMLAHS